MENGLRLVKLSSINEVSLAKFVHRILEITFSWWILQVNTDILGGGAGGAHQLHHIKWTICIID
jgi:hypothetical protein